MLQERPQDTAEGEEGEVAKGAQDGHTSRGDENKVDVGNGTTVQRGWYNRGLVER